MTAPVMVSMLRRDGRRGMRDTCVVWRKSPTQDQFGSAVDSWAPVTQPAAVLNGAGDLPCRVTNPGDHPWESQQADRVIAYATVRVDVPVGADARASDRVEHRGRWLEVSATQGDTTNETVKPLFCTELSGGSE